MLRASAWPFCIRRLSLQSATSHTPIGGYRFWRDLGYGIGALSLGVIADTFGGLEAGFWFTAVAMALSGMWVAFAMEETLARINPQDDD